MVVQARHILCRRYHAAAAAMVEDIVLPVTAKRERARPFRGPHCVVLAWWVLPSALTFVSLFTPYGRIAFRHDTLSFTIETFNALVATLVAGVGAIRYAFGREPFDLAVSAAFGSIAITALWFGLIVPFSVYTLPAIGDAPIYGWIITRLVAGLLLLVGLGGYLPRRWSVAIAALGSIALVDAGLWVGRFTLPTLFELVPGVSEALEPGTLFRHTVVGLTLQVGIISLYVLLAAKLSAAVQRGIDVWLALSFVTAAFAQIQFAFYPAPFHTTISNADLLWLTSYVLLLVYLGEQYLRAVSGLRRQQERASALLTLSQTTVASRDRDLVLESARRAIQRLAVPAEAEVVLSHTEPPPPSDAGNTRVYAIQADDTRYGWITVTFRSAREPEPETDEYIRTVANQTASLLRAIDLYDELAQAAVREERASLARELHDGLAQDLAVLQLRLEAAGSETLRELADRALAEARYAITILRGQTAAPTDFLRALERLAEDLADRFGCSIDVNQLEPLSDVPAHLQVALLRIIREAVINAGKHGQPQNITIQLRQRQEEIEAVVTDDGQGFDPSAPVPPGRFGLQSMCERARLLGGNLTVASQPGSGTSVRVTLPCLQREGAR